MQKERRGRGPGVLVCVSSLLPLFNPSPPPLPLFSLVKRRKDVSGHTTLFAESFGALADAEEIESLQKAMHQMADVEVKVARLHSKQENRDFYDFSEIVYDYLQMIQAVKVSLLPLGVRSRAVVLSSLRLSIPHPTEPPPSPLLLLSCALPRPAFNNG